MNQNYIVYYHSHVYQTIWSLFPTWDSLPHSLMGTKEKRITEAFCQFCLRLVNQCFTERFLSHESEICPFNSGKKWIKESSFWVFVYMKKYIASKRVLWHVAAQFAKGMFMIFDSKTERIRPKHYIWKYFNSNDHMPDFVSIEWLEETFLPPACLKSPVPDISCLGAHRT